ncbi:RNA polymerase sigma factor [Winogradskyella sp. HB-48]|uniref:RNA polymerase sigma factor n=1 Tax=Winogradskyella sp. HB-48 TaxID=3416808 RepID=UPI003CEE151A
MNSNKNIDADLVRSYLKGDNYALATLVKRWHKLFCDKAYWLVKDKDVAKDIAQESWTIIIKKIGTLKQPEQFKYWAYRIVCNTSTDWLRLRAKERNSLGFNQDIKGDDIHYTENDNLKKLLLRCVNELPLDQKAVVRLFYIESYSLKQISEILEISVGTAKSRLFHAREKLKKTLKHKYYEN